MIINTDNIIPKTELRENLTAIMDMVFRKKKTFAVSDRGTIISIIAPVEKKTGEKEKAKKKIELSKHPAFGMWKDDSRSDEEILNTLSNGWW